MSLASKSASLAAVGSYFVASSPTPGTGIASLAAPTAFDDTKPFILINNAHESKTLTLDYIKLTCTAPGTAGTALHYGSKIDGVNATRYTSGGSTLTPKNVNMGSSQQSSAVIYCGAIVAAAVSSAARLLGHSVLRPVIPVIGDTVLFAFGSDLGGGLASLAVAGTAICNVVVPHTPVLLAPTQWYALHLWLPSQSAACSFETEIAFVEE
jgi:hypothetical protein